MDLLSSVLHFVQCLLYYSQTDLACKKGLEEKRDFLMEKMVLVPSYIFETEQPFLTGNVLGAVGESNIPLPSDLDVHGAMATISNFVKSASGMRLFLD